jgi:hypothetical protein
MHSMSLLRGSCWPIDLASTAVRLITRAKVFGAHQTTVGIKQSMPKTTTDMPRLSCYASADGGSNDCPITGTARIHITHGRYSI